MSVAEPPQLATEATIPCTYYQLGHEALSDTDGLTNAILSAMLKYAETVWI